MRGIRRRLMQRRHNFVLGRAVDHRATFARVRRQLPIEISGINCRAIPSRIMCKPLSSLDHLILVIAHDRQKTAIADQLDPFLAQARYNLGT